MATAKFKLFAATGFTFALLDGPFNPALLQRGQGRTDLANYSAGLTMLLTLIQGSDADVTIVLHDSETGERLDLTGASGSARFIRKVPTEAVLFTKTMSFPEAETGKAKITLTPSDLNFSGHGWIEVSTTLSGKITKYYPLLPFTIIPSP